MFSAALFTILPALALAGPINKRYSGVGIQSGRNGQCLTLPSGVAPSNGALLTTGSCATATKWDINPGSGSVVITGTNFALDAGENPHDNVAAKVWTSYPGVTQQTWFFTGDNRIAITGGTQCLDQGDNGPQTYTCTTGNTNQVWNIVQGGGPGPSSSSSAVPPSSSASSAAPSSTSSSAPQPSGSANTRQLVWAGGKCVTVQSGSGGDGSIVNVSPCSAGSAAQQWKFNGDGSISFGNTNYCLDAGSNPASGTGMKLWTCYSGLAQQTWSYSSTSPGLYSTANNQCLDVDNSDNTKLQTWTCSSPDPQQQFRMA